jgi:serine/threonine protein kinase
LLRRDLVHGDVKPENIIKTEKGFKLVDFGGVTEIFSDVCKKGTPSFMAPERFEGAPVSEITEIFSIGVCLYKVLTDKFPYGEIEPFQKPSFKKPMEPKEINPDVPDWLNGIVLKAIQIDKNKRYQTYSEMLFDLNYPKKIESFFPLSVSYEETQNYKIYFILSLILNILLIFVLLY